MEEEGGLIGDVLVCVCVCVWSTASASWISITNRAARPVINTAILRYYKLQFITNVGIVQYATFSAICTVGLRAICGKSNVRWRGYLSLRQLKVAARRRQNCVQSVGQWDKLGNKEKTTGGSVL